jgi:hypothetical protein
MLRSYEAELLVGEAEDMSQGFCILDDAGGVVNLMP